jgi:hypothetical protein
MTPSTTATMTAPPQGSAALWTGRILSGLVILFFLLDACMKLLTLQVVTDTMAQLGWPSDPATAFALGILMVAIALLYTYRPTALLGAILMTAYLGGAVATHARIGSPILTHTLFGVYIGILAWGGLWLRNPALRSLFPMASGK